MQKIRKSDLDKAIVKEEADERRSYARSGIVDLSDTFSDDFIGGRARFSVEIVVKRVRLIDFFCDRHVHRIEILVQGRSLGIPTAGTILRIIFRETESTENGVVELETVKRDVDAESNNEASDESELVISEIPHPLYLSSSLFLLIFFVCELWGKWWNWRWWTKEGKKREVHPKWRICPSSESSRFGDLLETVKPPWPVRGASLLRDGVRSGVSRTWYTDDKF